MIRRYHDHNFDAFASMIQFVYLINRTALGFTQNKMILCWCTKDKNTPGPMIIKDLRLNPKV